MHKLPVGKIADSYFLKQLHEKRPDVPPVHFLMNVLGMSVFPFIMKPVFQASGIMNEKTFVTRMAERKALIPKWVSAMLKAK